MQLLIQVLVFSRLIYWNSLLAGLSASVTNPLQSIQKAAARLVFNLLKFSHLTPLLSDLHWLPVQLTSEDDGTGLQGHQRNCTHLSPNTGQTTCPRVSTSLQYISWRAGTAIAESKQMSLSEVLPVQTSTRSSIA